MHRAASRWFDVQCRAAGLSLVDNTFDPLTQLLATDRLPMRCFLGRVDRIEGILNAGANAVHHTKLLAATCQILKGLHRRARFRGIPRWLGVSHAGLLGSDVRSRRLHGARPPTKSSWRRPRGAELIRWSEGPGNNTLDYLIRLFGRSRPFLLKCKGLVDRSPKLRRQVDRSHQSASGGRPFSPN